MNSTVSLTAMPAYANLKYILVLFVLFRKTIQRARLPPQRPDFFLGSLEGKVLLGSPFSR